MITVTPTSVSAMSGLSRIPCRPHACPRSWLWTMASTHLDTPSWCPTSTSSVLSIQPSCHTGRPLWLPHSARHVSSSSSSPPSNHQHQGQDDQERDRLLNMGRAVHVLRHDLDHYCTYGLATTDIYARDMRFYDPHSHLHLTSLHQYLVASKVLRVLLHCYYVDPHLALTRLVQLRHPEPSDTTNLGGLADGDGDPDQTPPVDGSDDGKEKLPRDVRDDEDGALRVTFLLTGVPRHRYLLRLLVPAPLSDADVDQIEGVAMYTFNRAGLVHAHWIERLIPRPNLLRYLGGAASGGWWRRGPRGPTSVDEWRAGWCCEEVKVPLGRQEGRRVRRGKE